MTKQVLLIQFCQVLLRQLEDMARGIPDLTVLTEKAGTEY